MKWPGCSPCSAFTCSRRPAGGCSPIASGGAWSSSSASLRSRLPPSIATKPWTWSARSLRPARDLALYTGNDDNIVLDLLTPFRFQREGKSIERRIAGGLLGHWAVWTKRAVELDAECRRLARAGEPVRAGSRVRPQRLPTPTPRLSTPRTVSPAASPACTTALRRKASSRCPGAWTRMNN